jgi:hypothetical protein
LGGKSLELRVDREFQTGLPRTESASDIQNCNLNWFFSRTKAEPDLGFQFFLNQNQNISNFLEELKPKVLHKGHELPNTGCVNDFRFILRVGGCKSIWQYFLHLM